MHRNVFRSALTVTGNHSIFVGRTMAPHLKPGGVYICEDIHGINNGFNSYCQGLTKNFNEITPFDPGAGKGAGMRPNTLQAWIESVHFYPYLTVIVKAQQSIEKLISPRHGTSWQPIATT